jgi:Zn-finger nucleic acid-binding protein
MHRRIISRAGNSAAKKFCRQRTSKVREIWAMADTDLICPRCNLPLKQVQMIGRNFWACGNCGGRAVTLELLRHTFTPESINPLWLHAIRGQGTAGCSCPSCRTVMTQVALSDTATVKVDVCQHCHFVWFDAHEVDTLVPQPLPAAAPELPQKARELIAIEKVKQLAKQAQDADVDEWWTEIATFFR